MIHNSTVVHFSQKQQHFCLHPSSVFCLVARQPSNFFNAELASPFGKMPILTKRFGANTFQTSLHGCRANFSDWLLPLAFLFSTHFFLVFLKIVAQRAVRLSVSVSRDIYSHARITVVEFLDILMVSNSAELSSFLLTICTLARIHFNLSPSSGYFFYVTDNTHSSEANRM